MTTDDDPRPEFLRRLKPRHQRANPQQPLPPSATPASGYAARAFENEVATLGQTAPGGRNHQLNVSAFSLGQLVGGGLLEYGDVWAALHATALSIGLEPGETVTTLHSGLQAGMRQPRHVVPLEAVPEATVYLGSSTQGDTNQALHRCTECPTGCPDPGNTPKCDDCAPLEQADPNAELLARLQVLDWPTLWADQTKDEWIIEPLVPARRLVALFSPPKVGKSLFMLDLAVAVSRGQPFLGSETPAQPLVVLYVDFENDPRGDVRTRLQAMGLEPGDLKNLRYLSYPQLAKLDTLAGGMELLTVAQHHGAKVVVIDTISRAVGGEENDNDTWLAFYRNTGQQLKAAGIACVRLDHTGKDEAKGMRGGSAKYGDVDVVWAMTKVTDYTLRLDCTANRLPIAEKHLVVDRQLSPRLGHVLNMQGVNDALAAKVPVVCKVLDDAGLPNSVGYPTAWPYFNGKGIATKAEVKHALKVRQGRANAEQPLPGITAYKDD